MNDLSYSDQKYRSAMTASSNMLRNAVIAAKRGTAVVSPSKPAGLPRHGNERGLSAEKDNERRRQNRAMRQIPPMDRVRQLYESGATPQEIGAITKRSHQKITRMLMSMGLLN